MYLNFAQRLLIAWYRAYASVTRFGTEYLENR